MKTIHEAVEEAPACSATSETWHEKSRDEINAEMTSLREQLRTAHAAVSWTHAQMEIQKKRTKQLIAAWKVRLEEGEEKTRQHKKTMDNQMQKVASDLLYFEGALRREQQDIKIAAANKDTIIISQKRTIDSLTTANIALTKAIKKLKRKYKDSVRMSQEVTSSELIQQETDALISQIFANRQSSSTEGYSREKVMPPLDDITEVFSNSLPKSNMEQDRIDPHVFFYLTESAEKSSMSLKLKTNSALYPVSQPVLIPEHEYMNSIEACSDLSTVQRGSSEHSGFVQSQHYFQIQGDGYEQNSVMMSDMNPESFEVSPSMSCPNLGLAAIAEETNYVPHSGRSKSISYIDIDDIVSDVFSMSQNSCTSVSTPKSSITGTADNYKDQTYENIPLHSPLQKQKAFDEGSFRRKPQNANAIKEQDMMAPNVTTSKLKHFAPKYSSLNLLRRIRRPSDVKKKKVTRAKSDGDAIESLERQRKFTI